MQQAKIRTRHPGWIIHCQKLEILLNKATCSDTFADLPDDEGYDFDHDDTFTMIEA